MSDESWWRTAVIYQIYPRSFADGNGDGTGDLAGVRSRLPYLRSLGVDALWFTPWYLSPLADGGYDVADYRVIDPAFGTVEQAEQLIAEAATLGIRTIIDIVPNHVSSEHAWFRAALAAEPGAPERERFWFRGGEEVPTNWVSSFSGDTWTRTKNPDGTPGEWYLHLFTPEQPDLNWNHPDVRREHEQVLRFWFDRGVAGIRIDSATMPVKDPSLPQLGETEQHPYVDRDGVHDIYRAWRAVADSYHPPRVLVGEIWLADAERFARYLRPDEIHTAFNFELMARPWHAAELRDSIVSTLAAHAPVEAPATWVLSNHDVTRPVTRYGREDSSFSFATKRFGVPTDLGLGTRRARAAALLTAALPGSLYVYQGDELGLPEVEDLPLTALQDPIFHRSDGHDPGRDGCRVPLPWTTTGASFGFNSQGFGPWLPQPADWATRSVEAQDNDPDSMLTLYRSALRLRRSFAESFGWHELDTGDLIAFTRGDVLCLVNLGAASVPLPPQYEVLLASVPLDAGELSTDAAAWLRPIHSGV
ncbi:alpha amylase catalytic region [Kribbella flavida DSM 17836]|uniref:Alpha amylase catalytic region n=1 Tax=Kribbella flavida (strain DSM 17836 / JCM 10339 / NBRC 14399) TaxID=479435 RepID=D2PZ85_KRIFD|nr:alpha-amylase family glycosyl hydrolase [Kribbella flavida]ADB33694.1 alpha amylase catalytic region [Kribbella flavida DSM 17836]